MDPRVTQVETAMALIGSRWRPAIMFALIMMGTQRFSTLRRLIPGVSQRMLTKQLRDLERHGLVRRQFFESVPPRVEYSATHLGKSLHPIYKQVCEWAGANWPRACRAKQRYDQSRTPTPGPGREARPQRLQADSGSLMKTTRPTKFTPEG